MVAQLSQVRGEVGEGGGGRAIREVETREEKKAGAGDSEHGRHRRVYRHLLARNITGANGFGKAETCAPPMKRN